MGFSGHPNNWEGKNQGLCIDQNFRCMYGITIPILPCHMNVIGCRYVGTFRYNGTMFLAHMHCPHTHMHSVVSKRSILFDFNKLPCLIFISAFALLACCGLPGSKTASVKCHLHPGDFSPSCFPGAPHLNPTHSQPQRVLEILRRVALMHGTVALSLPNQRKGHPLAVQLKSSRHLLSVSDK